MTTKLNEKQLKSLIKESMKEVINSEMMKVRALLLPGVSSKEQKEIDKIYGTPSRKITKTYHVRL